MAGGILIVDDIATNRVVLKVKLAQAFHQTAMAEDGASCLRQAALMQPDLILLDFGLPDMDGVAVLHRLRADPRTRRIPVIVLSASLRTEDRLAALAAGAEDFLTKPADDLLLMARIRSLLRLYEDLREEAGPASHLAEDAAGYVPPGRIGLVMAQAERAMAVRRLLAGESRDRILMMTREAALAEQGDHGTEVFVIEAGGPTGLLPRPGVLADPEGGLGLLSDLRSRGDTRHAGVCLWLRADAPVALAAAGFDMGADDMLDDRMPPAEIALRLAGVLARRRAAARIRTSLRDRARLADVDALTGLWNRRYALPRLEAMARQAARTGTALAVMLVDLDRFKSVNDRCGHAAGDIVLTEVARRLSSVAPDSVVARWGGEEFLIARTGLNAGEARALAETLCHAITAQPVALPDMPPVAVSASVGIALGHGAEDPSVTLARADLALHRSKTEGRNRVTLGRSA